MCDANEHIYLQNEHIIYLQNEHIIYLQNEIYLLATIIMLPPLINI